MVIRGRLDPEEGAAVVAALTRGKEALEPGELEDPGAPAGARAKVTTADAFMLMVETMLANDTQSSIARHERTLVMLHADATVTEGHLHDGPAISTETLRRLACDAPACVLLRNGTERLDLGRTTRLPTRAQRRALMARDGGCRFPACTERRFVDAHHVQHWADGGATDLDNLVLLCWWHHHAMHEGGWSMAFDGGAISVWRPDGTLVETEALMPPPEPGIVEQHESAGLEPRYANEWDGSHPNYSWAIEGLLWLEDKYKREIEAVDAVVAHR